MTSRNAEMNHERGETVWRGEGGMMSDKEDADNGGQLGGGGGSLTLLLLRLTGGVTMSRWSSELF